MSIPSVLLQIYTFALVLVLHERKEIIFLSIGNGQLHSENIEF